MSLTRRGVLAASAATGLVSSGLAAQAAVTAPGPSRELLRRALAALDRHGAQITHRDLIAVVDFSQPSRLSRFHLVETGTGKVSSHLVAHGRGSDPGHTGWLERFSNENGSNASCAGAFRTDDYYVGAHGRSIRLTGLDATNSNAQARGIVVHGAWYVSPEMARTHGVLGRSEGCFAFSTDSLKEVMDRLGPGHMIYADKISA
jgi:hypothetical protein